MTRNELVDAYVRGEVDRRGFISRLTAMGVSAAAAAAYATTFARDASAAPASNGADFFIRAQGTSDPDEMYGTAFVIEIIGEAITALITALNAILDSLTDLLSTFTAEDFVAGGLEPGDSDLLQRINDQIDEQVVALSTFLDSLALSRDRRAFAAVRLDAGATSSTSDLANTLTTLSEEFARLVGLVAAIAPALESGEGRQLVTNIGLVSARQAALVNTMAGVDPLPGLFEVPIDPMSPQPTT